MTTMTPSFQVSQNLHTGSVLSEAALLPNAGVLGPHRLPSQVSWHWKKMVPLRDDACTVAQRLTGLEAFLASSVTKGDPTSCYHSQH